jgi:hypothetical protein
MSILVASSYHQSFALSTLGFIYLLMPVFWVLNFLGRSFYLIRATPYFASGILYVPLLSALLNFVWERQKIFSTKRKAWKLKKMWSENSFFNLFNQYLRNKSSQNFFSKTWSF